MEYYKWSNENGVESMFFLCADNNSQLLKMFAPLVIIECCTDTT